MANRIAGTVRVCLKYLCKFIFCTLFLLLLGKMLRLHENGIARAAAAALGILLGDLLVFSVRALRRRGRNKL